MAEADADGAGSALHDSQAATCSHRQARQARPGRDGSQDLAHCRRKLQCRSPGSGREGGRECEGVLSVRECEGV